MPRANCECEDLSSLSNLTNAIVWDDANKVSYLVTQTIKRWNYFADNVPHHFRAVFRGQLPFVMGPQSLKEFVARESLDAESTEYIERVLVILKSQGSPYSPALNSTYSLPS